MFLLSFTRILRFAFQSFVRNIWLTVVTVSIIILTIFSLTVLVLVNVISNQAIITIKDKVDISIYFEAGTKEEIVISSKEQIQKIDKVKLVSYVSADQALEKFKKEHRNDELILEALDEIEENPLGGVLLVKANDLNDYQKILQNIKDFKIDELAKEIDYDDRRAVINRIEFIGEKVKQIGLAFSIIFTIISLLVVFNTVRVAIYVHRDEIGIMKLVGASNWFIRGPFLIEAILYAVFGCLIFWIIFYVLAGIANNYLSGFFNEIGFNLIGYLLDNFFYIFGFEVLAIAILNSISSMLAMGRYLKT